MTARLMIVRLITGRLVTGRRLMVLLALGVVGGLAGGSLFIFVGSKSHPPAAAPVPVAQFAVQPGSLSRLPPLKQGRIVVGGPVPGAPGKRCSAPVSRSRLVIGSLCISGAIVPADEQQDGALTIPRDVHEIGLWNRGAQLTGPDGKPVREGATLLAGHVDYIGQGAGALYNLYQVRPGAVVYASNAAGYITRWRVIRLAVVPKAELPSWVFIGATGPRRLLIVTCGGPVRQTPGYGYSYRDNVMAVAVPG